MREQLGITILLISAGIVLIGMGIGAKRGYLKSLYLVKGVPGLYPSGYVYAFIPAGIVSFLLSLVMLLQDRQLAQYVIIFGLPFILVFSIILMTWKPRWLKPWWLQWLEDNYGDILEEILEEARSTKNFEQQTATRADLQAWADKAAQKYR